MKANDIENIQYPLKFSNMENIFNIYSEADGNYYYNLLRTVNIPKDIDPDYFDYYIVQTNDVWPLIAYKFYKNVTLWWLVCCANQILDPTSIPQPSTVIKVIKASYVNQILSTINK